uniref:Retrotransposon protein, putative, Ty1-copia subclass n=1 Tax=Tanacetum cinerariifolium TaxID=118510 RepID=A0A6L2KQD8_TANCI|nr:retrotransposon protein, putative, Ty1-copia subclass [Tanacetum cinerariifolium]
MIKYKADRSVERYKGRLVAQGFHQKEGVDYTETFALMAKMVIVRNILTMETTSNWHIYQLDINNAFLHEDLEEEVYMALLKGYNKTTFPNAFCRCLKEKLSGNNFNDWFRQLKLVLRDEKKMHVIKQPIPPAPAADSEANVLAKWNAMYDAHNEVACLMLGTKGKGKDKQVYIPKPKNPKPATKEHPAKDNTCHHYKEVGLWKRNCPVYLAELLKKKKQVGIASSSGIFTIELFALPNKSWVYDTGCGTHICITKQGFKEARKLKQGSLYFNGIYEIDMHDLVPNVNYIYNVSTKRAKHNLDSTYLWHCRLAHISKKRIEKLQHEGLLKSTDKESFDQCVSCLSGKITGKSFPHHPERATDLLRIIHTDVCGPLRHVSRQGASYFITFTDGYSRYGYVYLLKHKHEVFETFKVFKNEVENQLGKTIKALRSDRGGEYISQEFKDYLKACGIVQQLTPPYTPQHNGVSERRNRTLLDMVRSMINLTFLSLSFWDYALDSATRILNMVPTKKVDETSYELWYGKVPNLSYLKETMGYYFYFPSENKIVVARYDEFFERNLITQEVEGFEPPQKEVIPICSSERSHRAPTRLCLNVEVEEHSLGDLNEPTSYKAAMLDLESNKWIDAMNAEIQSMMDKMVWVLFDLPSGCKTVGSKWIFKKKTDMDGIVHTYKARLVAKGYTQLYEVDYEETFSPVANIRAIRILISIAVYYDYEISQIDVKTDFLNGYLDEDIYMVQLEGFVNPNHPRKVYKLQRSIYGLKQASRSWNERFDEEIKSFGIKGRGVTITKAERSRTRGGRSRARAVLSSSDNELGSEILEDQTAYMDQMVVQPSGLPKDKKKYNKSSKGNEVLQPKPLPNTKSFVRRLPKEVVKEKGLVKPKATPVESKVGKTKILVEDKELKDERDSDVDGSDGESNSDKEHKVSEEADISNESEEEEDERDSDVEGNESEKDGESEEDKETEVSKESDDSELWVKDVKIKGVKGNKTVVVSKAKKRMHVFDSSSEEDKRFARFVVRAFSASSYEFKLKKGIIRVTPEKVHEILGVPLGGNSIFDLPEIPLDDPFVKEWFKQFDPKPLKKIRACDIAEKLVLTKTVDFMFKVNFIMLFSNVMGTADTMKAIVNLTVLRRIHEDTNIAGIDWCGFIHKFLQGSSKPNIVGGFYIGPLCFLILLYLDSIQFDEFLVIRQRPAIRNKTTTAMNRRQELEIQKQVIGKLDLHGEWIESELDQTEGFYNVGENVSWTHTSSVPPTDKKTFCSMIEEKISMISAEKIALEDLLKKANAEFPNDEKVIKLCEKYRRLFKESLFVEDFQAHIDDSDNNDDDGRGKNDDHGSDNVGKKKESVAKDVVNAEKDRVNAEKDGVNVVQEGEADVNEKPEDMLEKESFTSWIEKKYRFAIIEWIIDEEHQWKVFSYEFSAQFEHDVSSISLSEVDLAFFPICASGHFYVVVFHFKSPSAMIILDNSNCGVTYKSKYKAVCEPQYYKESFRLRSIHDDPLPVRQWDLGLCEESDDHVSMLRCMRFKIATKSLLHEFNVHAEKMFHLAFKFESENDEQTRISIIVNAIKNRDERDPTKTKTFVDN